MPHETAAPLLHLKKISKSFPGICALTDVDLVIRAGEILGLVGENGAGKSTLAKVIGGILTADAGQIIFDGQKIEQHSIASAQRLGIAVIHQELNLIPHLSVEANLFLGREPRRIGIVDRSALRQQARTALTNAGLHVKPYQRVRELSIATRQRVEIAKALSLRSRLIIMDEPTSALSERESQHLLDLIRALKQRGIAVLYISHKLDEVLEICDRISVLRDGRNVGDLPDAHRERPTLERMMVGRHIQMFTRKERIEFGPVAFEVKNFCRDAIAPPVSFSVRAGEILGFAGLVVSGRTELMRSLFGAEVPARGQAWVGGQEIIVRSPRDAIEAGIGFVPEDRKEQGLILKMTVSANISLASIGSHSRWGWLNRGWEWTTSRQVVARLRIKTPSLAQRVLHLSGGNQQKIVLAKWLALGPKILILDEPTRGVDVGAKAELHRLIAEMAARGMAVVLISSEMEEIIGLSDRIIVMNQGCFAGELVREEISEENIMTLAAHRSAISN